MADLAIVIPTLGRAEVLQPLVTNIVESAPDASLFVLFVLREEDQASRDAIHDLGGYYVFAGSGYPRSANAGFRATEEPLILIANDDTVFHPGWYEAIMEAFDDDSVLVAGGSDRTPITANGGHVTQPFVRRSYIEDPGGAFGEPGNVYHEGYHHGWSETELWQLACHRGVARFVPNCVIEHKHPDWGTRDEDDTDRSGNRQGKEHDLALFEERKRQWAG